MGFFPGCISRIALEILHDAQAQGMKFFELPVEIKKKEGPRMDVGGLGNCVGKESSSYWAESLASITR
jgi:hypothetical protein